MSWRKGVKNWDGKLYKVLQGNESCHGGNFEWDLPKGDKPGNWTPIIENVEMCEKGYHLTTHYSHWSGYNVSIYEAEGDVIEFDGYDKVVCSRVRLLRLIENPFNKNNSGGYNSGIMNYGYFNSGNYNLGMKNSGNYNLGNWNSGNYNSGDFNSGSWNSGNCNSGYFCSCYKFNGMFNKLIPKNWEPKFPNWIYFNLLPEGYHTSWQKVFKSISLEDIKKLLALPNFDYYIFEEITSITRRQIEKKLRG